MAGNWIKMRKTLLTDARVVRISSALNADRLRVIGGLLSVWCIADDHGDYMEGIKPSHISELIGWPGFAEAMPADWLVHDENGVSFPNYESHNGVIARRRALDSVRKQSGRMSASEADKKRTRIEKSREDKKENATHSLANAKNIYQIYPRKENRPSALKAIQKTLAVLARTHDDPMGYLTKLTQQYAASPAGQSVPLGTADYRPYPASWFNGEGYLGDQSGWQKPNGDSKVLAKQQSAHIKIVTNRAIDAQIDERRKQEAENKANAATPEERKAILAQVRAGGPPP